MIRLRCSIMIHVCIVSTLHTSSPLWARRFHHHTVTDPYGISIAARLKDFKTTFDRTVTFLRWGGTNGLRFFLQFWYAKYPMFWIPRGWVPRYVEWMLAFPRAPTGSISIQVWGIACATVVQMVGAAVVGGLVLVQQGRDGEGRRKDKVAMGSGVGKEGGAKEL